MRCPNKKTQEWKDLVSAVGEARAYEEFVKNGYDIPAVSSISNDLASRRYYNTSTSNADVFGHTTSTSVLNQIANGTSPYAPLAEVLHQTTQNSVIPIRLLYNAPSPGVSGAFMADSNGGGVIDMYDTATYRNNSERVLLHEIIHGNTAHYIAANPSAKQAIREYMDYVRAYAIDNNNIPSYEASYGFTNEFEFVAEFFTSPEFQDFLRTVPAMDQGRFANLFNEILETIKSWIFGTNPTNAFEQLADVLFRIIQLQNNAVYESTSAQTHYYNDVRIIPETRTSDIGEVHRIFQEQTDKIEFLPDTHVYVNRETGVEYKPVSTVKYENGYGDNISDDSTTDSFRSTYNISAELGTMVHDYLDRLAKGTSDTFVEPDNLHISETARVQLTAMMNKIKQKAQIVASEQRVADDATSIAGTIDLLVKNEIGELVQLDYKTKVVDTLDSSGNSVLVKKRYGFTFYNSSKYGKPDKQKHDFQQTMYKRMSEMLGIDVKHKGILPIELVTQNNEDGSTTIVDVKLTSSLPLHPDLGYYSLTASNYILQPLIDGILGVAQSASHAVETTQLGRLEEIATDGLNALRKRASYLDIIGDAWMAENITGEIRTAETMGPVISALSVVKIAAEQMKPLMDAYNAMEARARRMGANGYRVWNLRHLSDWRNFALAFDEILDTTRQFYNENPEVFENVAGFDSAQFEEVLNSAIDYKNTLKLGYKEKGEKQWLEWIARGSSFIEYKWRNDFEMQYKRDWKAANPNGGTFNVEAMNTATEEYLAENQQKIKLETQAYMQSQARVAKDDINYALRMADNIFDSKDPIVGTMSKLYYNKMLEMRQVSNDWYIDLSNILDEFDKKYNTSSFANQRALYDYMLDESTTGGTAILVKRIPQSFTDAYRAEIERLQDRYKNSDNYQALISANIQEWLEEHAPFHEDAVEAMSEDKMQMYYRLFDEGVLTEAEYDALMQNENSEVGRSYVQMSADGELREALIYKLRKEMRAIRWEHRVPDASRYPNTKWDALSKMSDTDPKKKLYDFLMDTHKKGQMLIPQRFMLGDRLPGVRKDFMERALAGQDVSGLVKNSIRDTVSVTEDDTTRGQFATELANEVDQGINFVPVYFTNPLTEEDQSYDLPNIYKLWYKSALNYQFTQHLLPELEYTRFVVNNRTVTKRHRGREVVNRLATMYNNKNPNAEQVDAFVKAETNHLAEQLNSWFNNWVYGKSDKYLGSTSILGIDVDHAKVVRQLGHISSLKIMAVNFLSMVNNAAIAEINQLVEVHAFKLMTPKMYAKATWEYAKHLPDIMGDIGARSFKSKVNLANEYFNVFFDMADKTEKDRSRLKRLYKESSLFFTTSLGEHEVQSRFLIGTLLATEVFDHNGASLGSMWDNMSVTEDGRLQFSHSIGGDLNTLIAQVSRKVTQAIREMHGNYTDYSATAMSTNGILSLVQQFRKWIVPAVRRRYDREYYNEFADTAKLGYFRGGARYAKSLAMSNYYKVATYLGKVIDETKVLDAAVAADWDLLSDVEKQAVRRLATDVSLFTIAGLVLWALTALADDDDDKTEFEKMVLNNLMYQAYRAQTEQTFYINPMDVLRIIQSPMAAMSVTSSWGALFAQMLTGPFETYAAGKNKGESKLKWKLYKQIPVARQLYRVANADESLNALINPY